MTHPREGAGNNFNPRHTFKQAYIYVGKQGRNFRSNTSENIFARQSFARDKITKTIVFIGERSTHGNVCEACWGYRVNCNGTLIGQCSEALDKSF